MMDKIPTMLWCLTLSCVALSACSQTVTPEAVFQLEPYRKTVALRANVGGQNGRFVFDTGGGMSLLTPTFAEKIGVKPWGRLTGFQMMGTRIDTPRADNLAVMLGSKKFVAPVMGVFDVMSQFPKDAEPVDGILALDLFAGKTITIDFPARQLILESPASLRIRAAKAARLPVHLAREVQGRALAASVGVTTAKGLIWMELDSGNGGTILLSKPYASLFGLDPNKEGPQQVEFNLAPGLHVSGPAFAPDMILDGNIGMPFLKSAIVTLDLANSRLWIAPGASVQ